MEEAGLPQSEGPPPLPYSLRTRKKSIAFFWTLFVIDTLAQPLILYWALKYCTSLSLNLGTSLLDMRLIVARCWMLGEKKAQIYIG
jgi:hypothetical protein